MRNRTATDHYKFDKHCSKQDQKANYTTDCLCIKINIVQIYIYECKQLCRYAYKHTVIYNIFPSYISFISLGGTRTSLELCKSRLWNSKFRNTVTAYHQFINKLMIHSLCHKTLSEYFQVILLLPQRGWTLKLTSILCECSDCSESLFRKIAAPKRLRGNQTCVLRKEILEMSE